MPSPKRPILVEYRDGPYELALICDYHYVLEAFWKAGDYKKRGNWWVSNNPEEALKDLRKLEREGVVECRKIL